MENEQTHNNSGDAAETTAATPEQNSQSMTPEALEKLQAQSREYLEGWQRARAEFSNYKKRVEREMKDTYQNAAGDVLKGVLPIIDDFDRALANVPEALNGNPWVNGVSMIQKKMLKLLEDNGVTQFDPIGQTFDPNSHQAIGTDDVDNVASGVVTKTEVKGYAMGETILRPALVRVNR